MAFGNIKKFGSRDQRQTSSPVSVAQPESSADIAAQIQTLKAEQSAAIDQVEKMLGKPFAVKTFEADVTAAQFRAPTIGDALALRDRIVAAQFNAGQIAVKLQFLETQRKAARVSELQAGASHHAKILDRIAGQLIAALKIAASLNDQAMEAHEAARRDIGDEVRNYIDPIVYNGSMRTDSVALWAADLEKGLAVSKRKLAGLPPLREVRPPQHPESRPAGLPPWTPKPAPPSLQGPVSATDHPLLAMSLPPAAAKKPRTPDDHSPLEPGFVRVTVLRDGYETPGGMQCQIGQIVQIPEHIARKAISNNAVAGVVETKIEANASDTKQHGEVAAAGV